MHSNSHKNTTELLNWSIQKVCQINGNKFSWIVRLFQMWIRMNLMRRVFYSTSHICTKFVQHYPIIHFDKNMIKYERIFPSILSSSISCLSIDSFRRRINRWICQSRIWFTQMDHNQTEFLPSRNDFSSSRRVSNIRKSLQNVQNRRINRIRTCLASNSIHRSRISSKSNSIVFLSLTSFEYLVVT